MRLNDQWSCGSRRQRDDRGAQHTSDTFADACRRLEITQSMGRVGCVLDNAADEAVPEFPAAA